MESKKVVPSCCAKLIIFRWTLAVDQYPKKPGRTCCRNFSWPPSYLTESSSSQFGDGFYTIQSINLYRFISRISGQIGDWCFFLLFTFHWVFHVMLPSISLHPFSPSFHRVFTVFLMVKCPGFRQDHHTWDMENSAPFGFFWSQRIRFVGGETNHFFWGRTTFGFLLCKVTIFLPFTCLKF